MKNFAIGLWVVQTLAAIAMLIAASIIIESILTTGPVLAIVGLLLALFTRRLQSWPSLAFALSGPLVTAFISFLIAVFELDPAEAFTPTLTILTAYLLVISPFAVLSWLRILHWETVGTTPARPNLAIQHENAANLDDGKLHRDRCRQAVF